MLWLFFPRQPILQEVRMVSSPVSLSCCLRTSQLPVLGQPAAAGDRCEETVVCQPPGGVGSCGKDGSPGRPGAGPSQRPPPRSRYCPSWSPFTHRRRGVLTTPSSGDCATEPTSRAIWGARAGGARGRGAQPEMGPRPHWKPALLPQRRQNTGNPFSSHMPEQQVWCFPPLFRSGENMVCSHQ